MATGNFLNRNANKIFAINIENENDIEFAIDNMECDFEKEFGNQFEIEDCTESNPVRSFYGKTFGIVSEQMFISNISIEIKFELIIRSGYYSGVNFDWNCLIDIEGNLAEFDMMDTTTIKLILDNYLNAGLATIFAKKINKWSIENYKSIVEKIQNIYANNTINLPVFTQFFNGETIYKKI